MESDPSVFDPGQGLVRPPPKRVGTVVDGALEVRGISNRVAQLAEIAVAVVCVKDFHAVFAVQGLYAQGRGVPHDGFHGPKRLPGGVPHQKSIFVYLCINVALKAN
jgi:hypothetical protein